MEKERTSSSSSNQMNAIQRKVQALSVQKHDFSFVIVGSDCFVIAATDVAVVIRIIADAAVFINTSSSSSL